MNEIKIKKTLSKLIVKNPLIKSEFMPSDFGLKYPASGKGIKIGIVGTGLPNYSGINNVSSFEMFTDNDDDPDDNHGLSTYIAGIIGSNNNIIRGISPSSELFLAKAINSKGNGKINSVIASILWCMIKKVNMIFLPFEFKEDPSDLEEIVEKAYKENIAIFLPMTKRNSEKGYFPSNSDYVMRVATFKMENSYYSNVKKELYAPINNQEYIKIGSISTTTAIVAGLASNIIQNNKNISISDLYKKISILSSK